MRIVMTGATAGLGRFAAERMLAAGHQLVVGARRPEQLPDSLAGRVDARVLDLDRLQSVRDFAASLSEAAPIDALVLNAGVQLTRPVIGADGFERTFAVNHLAHYLLLRLLEPRMARPGRIVLTSSGTHDPAEGTPVTPPVHANPDWLAYPDQDPTAERFARKAALRAYSSSKLANILTAREAARRHPDLGVAAYDPGYVPWTGLGRENGRILAAIASTILPLVLRADRTSTIPQSGQFLFELATSPAYAQQRGAYFSVRGDALLEVQPSELARDDAAAALLWQRSGDFVGLQA